MADSKRFYQYTPPKRPQSGKLWGYRRVHMGDVLRKQGFSTKAEAEAHLRSAMNEIDDAARGIVRTKPTTMHDALDPVQTQADSPQCRKVLCLRRGSNGDGQAPARVC
jgi:hypothetical protein